MDVGVYAFITDYGADAISVAHWVEERGFESIFLPEHSHIPTSRRSPWPGGAELPRAYMHALDPFVTLSAMAASTRRLKLGLGVCLAAQRHPILMAKEVASLDFLSEGRVILGVGGGWNVEEMAHHGVDANRRWDIVREHVLAAKQLWARDEAGFHGEFVEFDASWAWPKPIGKVPVLIGGDGPGTFRRVLDFGDGWMPIHRGSVDRLESRMRELRRLAQEASRGAIEVSVFATSAVSDTLAQYERLGVDRVVLPLSSDDPHTVQEGLDALAEAAEKYLRPLS
jgi:probable F420-dependent oxidoreductase